MRPKKFKDIAPPPEDVPQQEAEIECLHLPKSDNSYLQIAEEPVHLRTVKRDVLWDENK